MMDTAILGFLQQVNEERAQRAANAAFNARVVALKDYQQRRFSRSYADLLSSRRYGGAAKFFLQDLYGPDDFSARDAQFARVVPGLVRLFPVDVVRTVCLLAELHAISERLDSRMARAVAATPITAAGYVQAWQSVGEPALRQRQIDLTMTIGAALEAYTRKPLLRQALRVMRGPASAAGMSALQSFLEKGLDIFKTIKGSDEFLAAVREREQTLAQALFDRESPARLASRDACLAGDDPLGQLP